MIVSKKINIVRCKKKMKQNSYPMKNLHYLTSETQSTYMKAPYGATDIFAPMLRVNSAFEWIKSFEKKCSSISWPVNFYSVVMYSKLQLKFL